MSFAIDRMSGAEMLVRGIATRIGDVPVPERLVDVWRGPGVVYAVQGKQRSPVKIGYTADDPEERLLGLQTGNPDKLRIIALAEGYITCERRAHALLAKHRLHGEWFAWHSETAAFVRAMDRGIEHAIAVIKVARRP